MLKDGGAGLGMCFPVGGKGKLMPRICDGPSQGSSVSLLSRKRALKSVFY